MCCNKSHLGAPIHVPATGSPSGEGARTGVVRRILAERAMLESAYQDEGGEPAFDGSSQLFFSINRGARAMELIRPTTTDMWSQIAKQREKKSHTHINLVMSFGRKKIDSDHQQGFEYESDYSDKVSNKEIIERSPEKQDDRTEAVKRRDQKIAANSKERPAEAFITKLYESTDSPVHRGFSFEHATAMRKAFSVLKIRDKYVWEVFTCTAGVLDTWPTLTFLTLESFKNLPLAPADKAIKRDKFQPENGDMPYRQLTSVGPNSTRGEDRPAGGDLKGTFLPICESMERSSKFMGDAFLAGMQKPTPSTEKFRARILFMRKTPDGKHIYETMSETYQDPTTLMGEVFDEIWIKDTSPVFLLSPTQEKGLMEKTHEYKMFVSSERSVIEKPYTEETFSMESLSNMVNLVSSGLVKVRIECAEKCSTNVVRRRLFSWRSTKSAS